MSVPEPRPTAREVLDMARQRGARIHRYRAIRVCCLTKDRQLADTLLKLGARRFLSPAADNPYPRGDGVEWDLELQQIEVSGPETIWEAAA